MKGAYCLDREEVLIAAAAALGGAPALRDFGLLEAGIARPATTVSGLDAYPDLLTKAGALLQSSVRNRPLVNGNKRTAWASAWTFVTVNGTPLDPAFDVDAAEDVMNAAATHNGPLANLAAALKGFGA